MTRQLLFGLGLLLTLCIPCRAFQEPQTVDEVQVQEGHTVTTDNLGIVRLESEVKIKLIVAYPEGLNPNIGGFWWPLSLSCATYRIAVRVGEGNWTQDPKKKPGEGFEAIGELVVQEEIIGEGEAELRLRKGKRPFWELVFRGNSAELPCDHELAFPEWDTYFTRNLGHLFITPDTKNELEGEVEELFPTCSECGQNEWTWHRFFCPDCGPC